MILWGVEVVIELEAEVLFEKEKPIRPDLRP